MGKHGVHYNSITEKLTWINMLVSAVALLVACGVFVAFEWASFRSAMVRSLSIEAQMIATNSASAVTFNDPAAASDALEALKAAPNVIAAGIYTISGEPLAIFWRDGVKRPLPLPSGIARGVETYSFESRELLLTRPSIFRGKQIGSVYIRSDLGEMIERVKRNTVIVATVLLLSLIAAFVTSSNLLRAATRPIMRLVGAAQAVSRERDYAARVPETNSNDEVQLLIHSFNEMLSQIQTRDEGLRASQEEYRTLAESLPHLVWTCTADGLCDYLSPQWAAYTGRSAAEQLGQPWMENVHPEDRERVQAVWAEAVQQGKQFDAQFRIGRFDGVSRWFRNRSLPFRDGAGNVVRWFCSNTDFDDYKKAEQTLNAHIERLGLLDRITRAIGARQDLYSVFQVVLATLEENLPVDFGCICLQDTETDALKAICIGPRSQPLSEDLAIAEQSEIDISGNGLAKCLRGILVYEPDVSKKNVPFARRLSQGGLRSLVCAPLLFESKVFGALIVARYHAEAFSSGECEFLRQVSEHVALAAQQAQIHAALQQAYDDLHRTQQTVMQQERLRALGQMASGIAHDINNALSPMALYTESLLQREPNLSPRTRTYLETAQRALEDVAHTVGRMQEFYRSREPQLTLAPVQLNRLIEQVLELTRARWRDMPQERGIVLQLELNLTPDLPEVMGIEGEIRDALTNLIFNATDAMPAGGSLQLRTRSVSTGTAVQVHVEVTDTGLGMDEETRKRCLEPFFTTKGERGTGLGLAMVYGMTRRHGGEIEIDSTRGVGTTVRMIFPAAVTQPLTHGVRLPQRAVQSLRILIVDDDPMVIKSLREVLEMEGHVVTAAEGGAAGITAFASAQRDGNDLFEIVITDLGMPVVDGATVAAAIKAISPSTPVILLTGWGQRLTAENDIPPHVDIVLSKPPKLKELRAAFVELVSPAVHAHGR